MIKRQKLGLPKIKLLYFVPALAVLCLVPVGFTSAQTEPMPSWMRSNAGLWSGGQIDSVTFVSGIEYVITKKIIMVPETDSDSGALTEIPGSSNHDTKRMTFELVPQGEAVKNSAEFNLVNPDTGDPAGSTVNISWDNRYGAGDEIPFNFEFFDESGNLLKDVVYAYWVADESGSVIMSAGDDPDNLGVEAMEGIDVQKITIPTQKIHRIDVLLLGQGLDLDPAYAGIGSVLIEVGPSSGMADTVEPPPAPQLGEISIPSWVRSNAGLWADELIDDETFLAGIEFLIDGGIINVGDPATNELQQTIQEKDRRIQELEDAIREIEPLAKHILEVKDGIEDRLDMLEETIQEKDRRIKELKAENQRLRSELQPSPSTSQSSGRIQNDELVTFTMDTTFGDFDAKIPNGWVPQRVDQDEYRISNVGDGSTFNISFLDPDFYYYDFDQDTLRMMVLMAKEFHPSNEVKIDTQLESDFVAASAIDVDTGYTVLGMLKDRGDFYLLTNYQGSAEAMVEAVHGLGIDGVIG